MNDHKLFIFIEISFKLLKFNNKDFKILKQNKILINKKKSQ